MNPPVAIRADDAAFVDACAHMRAAYIHIPFCARVCPYCDFAVVEGRDDAIGAYVGALLAEVDGAVDGPSRRSAGSSAKAEGFGPLDAVFIGGGTPSYIDPHHLAVILERLDARFGFVDDPEVTIEANPEDWSEERAERVRAAGVGRVSFGAQSLQASTLDYLGRRHSPDDVVAAVGRSRSAGFESVSLDVIFGAPDEPPYAWADTVDGVIALDPDHVSAYALTVELGTPLSRAVRSGAPAPDPDISADAYEHVANRLEQAGYAHYEVSNWARPGHGCRYNLIAWAQGEYLGFGVGAHSHVGGERSWNIRRLDTYIGRSGRDVVSARERLEPIERERERILIGLRRTAGVRAGELGERWAASPDFDRLREAGVAEVVDGRIVITDPLRADTAGRLLMAFEPDEA